MKKISLSKLDEFFAADAASKNLYLPVDGANDFFFTDVESLAAF